jgi:flagellar hook-basal body complex protein FliE
MEKGMGASIAAVQARIAQDAHRLASAPIKARADIDSAAGDPSTTGIAGGFRQIIDSVNAQDRAAAEKMAAVDSGESDDLVGAILASQEASLSFSMLMQVRNKVVGALEDLIKLQL